MVEFVNMQNSASVSKNNSKGLFAVKVGHAKSVTSMYVVAW